MHMKEEPIEDMPLTIEEKKAFLSSIKQKEESLTADSRYHEILDVIPKVGFIAGLAIVGVAAVIFAIFDVPAKLILKITPLMWALLLVGIASKSLPRLWNALFSLQLKLPLFKDDVARIRWAHNESIKNLQSIRIMMWSITGVFLLFFVANISGSPNAGPWQALILPMMIYVSCLSLAVAGWYCCHVFLAWLEEVEKGKMPPQQLIRLWSRKVFSLVYILIIFLIPVTLYDCVLRLTCYIPVDDQSIISSIEDSHDTSHTLVLGYLASVIFVVLAARLFSVYCRSLGHDSKDSKLVLSAALLIGGVIAGVVSRFSVAFMLGLIFFLISIMRMRPIKNHMVTSSPIRLSSRCLLYGALPAILCLWLEWNIVAVPIMGACLLSSVYIESQLAGMGDNPCKD